MSSSYNIAGNSAKLSVSARGRKSGNTTTIIAQPESVDYKCLICGKAFSSKLALRGHNRVHRNRSSRMIVTSYLIDPHDLDFLRQFLREHSLTECHFVSSLIRSVVTALRAGSSKIEVTMGRNPVVVVILNLFQYFGGVPRSRYKYSWAGILNLFGSISVVIFGLITSGDESWIPDSRVLQLIPIYSAQYLTRFPIYSIQCIEPDVWPSIRSNLMSKVWHRKSMLELNLQFNILDPIWSWISTRILGLDHPIYSTQYLT